MRRADAHPRSRVAARPSLHDVGTSGGRSSGGRPATLGGVVGLGSCGGRRGDRAQPAVVEARARSLHRLGAGRDRAHAEGARLEQRAARQGDQDRRRGAPAAGGDRRPRRRVRRLRALAPAERHPARRRPAAAARRPLQGRAAGPGSRARCAAARQARLGRPVPRDRLRQVEGRRHLRAVAHRQPAGAAEPRQGEVGGDLQGPGASCASWSPCRKPRARRRWPTPPKG